MQNGVEQLNNQEEIEKVKQLAEKIFINSFTHYEYMDQDRWTFIDFDEAHMYARQFISYQDGSDKPTTCTDLTDKK